MSRKLVARALPSDQLPQFVAHIALLSSPAQIVRSLGCAGPCAVTRRRGTWLQTPPHCPIAPSESLPACSGLRSRRGHGEVTARSPLGSLRSLVSASGSSAGTRWSLQERRRRPHRRRCGGTCPGATINVGRWTRFHPPVRRPPTTRPPTGLHDDRANKPDGSGSLPTQAHRESALAGTIEHRRPVSIL